MSYYYIKYACGHEVKTDVQGWNSRERDEKAEWLAKGICQDCKKAEEVERDARFEDEMGLSAEMKGSDKQVAWARTLRRRRYEQFCDYMRRNFGSGKSNELLTDKGIDVTLDRCIAAFVEFARGKDARFWIDTRDDNISYFLSHQSKAIGLEIVEDGRNTRVLRNKFGNFFIVVSKPLERCFWFHNLEHAATVAAEIEEAARKAILECEDRLVVNDFNDE